jgi:NitT/TauT family transport system substrate-binding protein
MLHAIQHMQRWLAEHSAAELAEVAAPFFPEVARDVLVTSLERYREAGLWSRTPTVSQEGFDRLAESLLSGGFISRRPTYADCVDRSIA